MLWPIVESPTSPAQIMKMLSEDIVLHHLALFGFGGDQAPDVIDAADPANAEQARAAVRNGLPVVALGPSEAFLRALGLSTKVSTSDTESVLKMCGPATDGFHGVGLRTFHAYSWFHGGDSIHLEPIVSDKDGHCVWGWMPLARSGVLLVGTSLSADLVLIRQGSPGAIPTESDLQMWGYQGERPNYLFRDQFFPSNPSDRQADWWVALLRSALIQQTDLCPEPVLPNGAPGVLVVTGDDDAALREHYENQCQLLDGLPITYFALQETSVLDGPFMHDLSSRYGADWQLHPNALSAPGAYPQLLSEQIAWFESLYGCQPKLVRNHGFLSQGYWGHLPSWLQHSICGSSNLPGFDGQVLNGSLLPARLVSDGHMTDHWSLLNLVGDGVVFAENGSDEIAHQIVLEKGREILDSGVPGVVCLNLHPVNLPRTGKMHRAAMQLVDMGFLPLTFAALLDWCRERDSAAFGIPRPTPIQR